MPALEHSGVPIRYVREMVKRGENGIASGIGIYDWRGVDRRRTAQDVGLRLKRQLAFLQSHKLRDTKLVLKPRKVEVKIY